MSRVSINRLKLGNKSYADLTTTMDDEQLLSNSNRVYVDTNDARYTDLLQLEFRAREQKVKLGRAKYYDVKDRAYKYVDIYVPTILYPFCNCNGTPSPTEHFFDNNFTLSKDFNVDEIENQYSFGNNYLLGKDFIVEGVTNDLAFDDIIKLNKSFTVV